MSYPKWHSKKDPGAIREAFRWYPGTEVEGVVSYDGADPTRECPFCGSERREHGICLVEAHFSVCPGNWLIRVADGWIPCPDGYFQTLFEPYIEDGMI